MLVQMVEVESRRYNADVDGVSDSELYNSFQKNCFIFGKVLSEFTVIIKL